MFESLVFILLTVVGCVGLTWYLMDRRVKNINEQLSDKQVVINELAHYAEKISNETDSVVVKKPLKKVANKKTKPTTKPKKETKKVEEKPIKKGRKPKQK